jgi:hypothetical protein
MKRSITIYAVAALVFMMSGTAWADTHYVDPAGSNTPPYTTAATAAHSIQDAIDAAVGGDKINVAAGTYYENITLKDGQEVLGAGADVTTIDGSSNGPVVTAINVDSTAKLDGFTIANGHAYLYPVHSGGGIHLRNSSPTISNNVISGNRTDNLGGGIFLYYSSSSTISNNFITNNNAYGGAGIYMWGGTATISNNVIMNNSCGSSGLGGGGIYLDYTTATTILNNVIAHNGGGGKAGGIGINGRSPTIMNNTIVSNSAQKGSGIYNWHNSSAVVDNSIIWGNTGYWSTIYLDYSNYSENTTITINYSDVQGGYTGIGNISVDPQFVNPMADDYHLQSGPCINTGNNAALPPDTTDLDGDGDTTEPIPFDLDGNPRIVNTAVDMGAYECYECVTQNTPPGDHVVVYDPESGTTITFDSVEQAGNTTVTVTQHGAPPPTGLKLVPSGMYYEIITTAAYSGMIQIAIEYDDTALTEGQENTLKLRVYEEEEIAEWVDITAELDTENNIIYGEIDHLSLFAVTHSEPPEVTITSPASGCLVSVNDEILFEGAFTDPDVDDTHTATWTVSNTEWVDDLIIPATVDNENDTVGDTIAFPDAGIYSFTLTVTDNVGASDVASTVGQADLPAYVVIYDPEGGFVTGGGWIYSEAGAYKPDLLLAGKANFGFVSKYKKGATVPTGNTEFQFKAGNLNFHSSSYEWLVVTGSNYARFKGSGTINGGMAPNGEYYRFMLWAKDDDPDYGDTFRIRIWQEDNVGNETDVYDNGFDQTIEGGSIVVHTGKK